MRTLIALAIVYGAAACYLPDSFHAVFADMHDGDKKEVTVTGSSMVIKPSGSNQTWTVKAVFDRTSCSADVDFNVPGKPKPPPVNLTLSYWTALTPAGRDPVSKATFEWFDPSGKLAPADVPVNTWVQLDTQSDRPGAGCPMKLQTVFADMHDGDKKNVKIDGSSLIITPGDIKENWTVKAKLDTDTCTAIVDFNVPGKPHPPTVKFTLSLWNLFSLYQAKFQEKVSFEFTDASGTLSTKDYPLNTWVSLKLEPSMQIQV